MTAEHKGLCHFKNILKRHRTKKDPYYIKKEYIKRTTPIKYPLNTRIEAKFRILSNEVWWSGTIVCVHRNDTYDICYDDGNFEKNKPENRIRILNKEDDMSEDEIA